MSHTSVEAGSASDPVTILARLWCLAEGNNPDDTISDAGHTVLDGLMGGLDRKAMAAILQAERDLRAAITSPAAVPESVRRLSEAAHRLDRAPLEQNTWPPTDKLTRARSSDDFCDAWQALREALLADAPPSVRAGEESTTSTSAGAVPEGRRSIFVEGHLNDLYRSGERPNLKPPAQTLPNAGDRVMLVETSFAAARSAAPAAPETPTEAPAHGSAEGGTPWSEHSPQEIVRRTRCMAAETRDAVLWRDCCDLILERIGPTPETPPTTPAEGRR